MKINVEYSFILFELLLRLKLITHKEQILLVLINVLKCYTKKYTIFDMKLFFFHNNWVHGRAQKNCVKCLNRIEITTPETRNSLVVKLQFLGCYLKKRFSINWRGGSSLVHPKTVESEIKIKGRYTERKPNKFFDILCKRAGKIFTKINSQKT